MPDEANQVPGSDGEPAPEAAPDVPAAAPRRPRIIPPGAEAFLDHEERALAPIVDQPGAGRLRHRGPLGRRSRPGEE